MTTKGKMQYIFTCLFLGCVSFVLGSPKDVVPRTNSILDAPYFISIEADGKYLCSGTILDDSYIVTSKTCVGSLDVNKTEVFVRAGTDRLSFRGQDLRVISIISDNNTDLALLQTASDFEFGTHVWWTNPNNEGITAGLEGVITAWVNKEVKKSPLVVVPVQSIPHADCVAALAGIYTVTSKQACLQPTVAASHFCLADLGAPFYLNEQLYGVVSYSGGCDSQLPLVATPISPSTSFIVSTFCGMKSIFD